MAHGPSDTNAGPTVTEPTAMTARYLPVVLVLLSSAAGCADTTGPGPLTVGDMDLEITGAFQRSFRSGASFGTGGVQHTDYDRIYVQGGDSIDRLTVEMLDRIAAPPGSYPLAPDFASIAYVTGDTTGQTAGAFAVLRHGDDAYMVESGTLTIIHAPDHWFASEDEVDGRFDFTAVYWCTGTCQTLPRSYSPDLPRIHVSGEFRAAPPRAVPAL